MAPQPEQLELFCVACSGLGAIVADTTDHHGEPVRVPMPCPVCWPSPALAETVEAVAALGRRLEPKVPAAGR
jgi:hypothetical protein